MLIVSLHIESTKLIISIQEEKEEEREVVVYPPDC